MRLIHWWRYCCLIDCALHDPFGRRINYLRVSVTDRCNLRCIYCMPEHGIERIAHEDILSFEEIAEFVRAGVDLGIDKIRLTGGEPLVRKGVVSLVRLLAEIRGIRDLAMTTNGVLLEEYSALLKEAGLHRLNISLDTVDPARFSGITRRDHLPAVLRGIDAAARAGFSIKLNCVIRESRRESDALAVEEYGRARGFEVRFIRRMDLGSGIFHAVEGGEGGHCPACNRLRLTASGMLYPCLFCDECIDIKKSGYHEALRRAVGAKPLRGTRSLDKFMINTGG